MSELRDCEFKLGWCLTHVGRREVQCHAISESRRERARAQAVEQIRIDAESRAAMDQQQRINTFTTDARALIALEPRQSCPTSVVHEKGTATCVGRNYGVCQRDPDRPWLFTTINRLEEIEDTQFPFFFCDDCANILDSRGIFTVAFPGSDLDVRAAHT